MLSKAFLDLDGTVHVSGRLLDEVGPQIRRLNSSGVQFFYMTNNTSESSLAYKEKIESFDLPYFPGCVISPTKILSDFLVKSSIRSAYLVGTEKFRDEVISASNISHDEASPEIVIIAFDKELSYEKLEVACALVNRGIPYYLTHIDLACPSKDGPIPDCGSIGKLVEVTTGVKPKGHFGKPGFLLQGYLNSLISQGERVLVAGDRVYTDGATGLAIGADTVIVCTGEYKRGDPIDSKIIVSDTLAEYLKNL